MREVLSDAGPLTSVGKMLQVLEGTDLIESGAEVAVGPTNIFNPL